MRQVTHPFHPLRGRALDVVDRRRCQDGEYVYVEVDGQRVERLPSAWDKPRMRRSGRDHSRRRSLFPRRRSRALARDRCRGCLCPSERREMAEARSMRNNNLADT